MSFDLKAFLGRLVPALLAALLAGLGVAIPVRMSGCGSAPTVPTCPAPPPDTKPPAPGPTKDPVAAIGRLAMDGGFCSATVVTAPDAAGRQRLVSAAHCVERVGERVTFIPRQGGHTIPCTVLAFDRKADISIIATAEPTNLPYIGVAQQTPPVGSEVMHAGFGVDVPGNVERGQVLAGVNPDGQVRYRLSVSPGDSGGGICLTSAGELLSPVCCTDRLAGVGNVWGGSPENIRRMLANPTQFLGLPPKPMPPPPALDKK